MNKMKKTCNDVTVVFERFDRLYNTFIHLRLFLFLKAKLFYYKDWSSPPYV